MTEDKQSTLEVRGLEFRAQHPLDGWPIAGSGFELPFLEAYTEKEILSNIIPDGFRYSYGARLLNYRGINQIDAIIATLKRNPSSRRAVAITYDPARDIGQESIPCLQLADFLIRGDELHGGILIEYLGRVAPDI
jgi:thymidylate synthase